MLTHDSNCTSLWWETYSLSCVHRSVLNCTSYQGRGTYIFMRVICWHLLRLLKACTQSWLRSHLHQTVPCQIFYQLKWALSPRHHAHTRHSNVVTFVTYCVKSCSINRAFLPFILYSLWNWNRHNTVTQSVDGMQLCDAFLHPPFFKNSHYYEGIPLLLSNTDRPFCRKALYLWSNQALVERFILHTCFLCACFKIKIDTFVCWSIKIMLSSQSMQWWQWLLYLSQLSA